MLAIAQKLGFTDLASFAREPEGESQDAAGLGGSAAGCVPRLSDADAGQAAAAVWTLPKAQFEVVPVPDYLEKTSAPAYYEEGTPDGSRPGRLFIDTYNATDRNLYSVEDIAYHEGIPGHHLQISIAQEIHGYPDVPQVRATTRPIRRDGRFYSERLGKDVGFYQDPYSDYGRLEGDIWRAIRLVVDTGVHFAALDARADGRVLPRPLERSTRPAFSRRWTATLRGRARRWRTRWGS